MVVCHNAAVTLCAVFKRSQQGLAVCVKQIQMTPLHLRKSRFDDGAPMLQSINCGKGKIYFSGISMGYCYDETESRGIEKFLQLIMDECGIEKYKNSDFKNGIYEKHLLTENERIIFIFNNSTVDKTAVLDGYIIAFGADAVVDGNRMTVRSGEIGYAVINR